MIPRWEDRVDAMDTGKGVSNKMIQTAMRAEIKDLRKALWWAERRLVQARQQRDDLKKTVTFVSIEGKYDIVIRSGDSNRVVRELKKRYEVVKWRRTRRD